MFASPIGAGTEMTPVMCERCNPVSRQDDMDVNPTTSQTDPASASTGINPSPVDGLHQDWPLEMELADVEAFGLLRLTHHPSKHIKFRHPHIQQSTQATMDIVLPPIALAPSPLLLLS